MNKIALITGGGRGIGAATAKLLAQQGYSVCVNYVQDQISADEVVAQIANAGGQAIAVQADVAREDDVQALFEHIDVRLGRLDALVNNAAILERQMRLQDMAVDRWQRVFATNIIGSFLCAREAVKRMPTDLGGNGGAIVNVSSMAARYGSPDEYIDYAASKGAIDTMTIGLAKEVASQGVRVNAVRPGSIHTDMHASGGEPDRIERVKLNTPMQRGGYPEEIANAIAWLLSVQASYATGAILDVSGGK